MNRAAWWTCALLVFELTFSHARIYERCELARDLRALGVNPDHISTWVCIAYHESRFDTAANNPHSGDHGLFQISELYWCGTGKACGLSCATLRDDDITDDLECALQVHEEHTRLQGDGFLAWVVYPQHCKHSTKKYLIDCDENLKNTSLQSQGRSFNALNSYENRYRTRPIDRTYSNNPNIDNLLPPYLTVSSIFRGSYGKVLDYNQVNNVDWYNYKYDDVDKLKLPDFVPGIGQAPVTTTRTTTASTTYVPPVKPWRFIESNQFRKKAVSPEITTLKPSTYQNIIAHEKYTTITSTYKPPTESITHKSRNTVSVADISPKVKSMTTSYKSPSTLTSTIKPVSITNTAYKSPTFTTSYKSPTTTTYRPQTSNESSMSSRYNYLTSTSRILPSFTTNTKTKFPPFAFTFPTTTQKPTTVTTTILSFPTRSYIYQAPSYSTTTIRPSTWTYKTTTAKPTTIYKTTLAPTTRLTTPWYTFTSRLRSFGSSSTSYPQFNRTTTTSRYPQTMRAFFTSPTQKPTQSTTALIRQTTSFPSAVTQKPFQYPTYTTKKATYSTSAPRLTQTTTKTPTTQRTVKTTQNIFDLYLNPTKAPKLPPFSFSPRSNSKFNINIFSGGTTSTITPSIAKG